MREIKFRAWDKKRKEWIDLYACPLVLFGNGVGHILFDIGDENFNDEIIKLEDVILVQYTGLKDKSGKEIYEGDIVKLEADFGTENYIAEWENVYLRFSFKSINPSKVNMRVFKEESVLRAEIIGNIYENPELIK